MNAADILAALWEGRTWGADDPRAAEEFRPYSGEFPGLAPATAGPPLTKAETERALDSLPPAHVCLVAAGRPADVLAVTGWQVSDAWDSPLLVAAVLRSWEDRFGARLLQLGPGAEIRLLAGLPARTPGRCAGHGGRGVGVRPRLDRPGSLGGVHRPLRHRPAAPQRPGLGILVGLNGDQIAAPPQGAGR